jgi:hypothetical protein
MHVYVHMHTVLRKLNITSIILKVTAFLDFVHRPKFQILKKKNTTPRKLDPFPSSGEETETPTLLGPLERANAQSLDCPSSLVVQ